MSEKSNNTLIYAPEIQVLIVTKGSGVVDISDDVVNFQLRRVMNAASQFSCVLNNRNQKYNGVLGRMDRIVVYLKRTTKMQVFAGYLDSVPGLSLYTNTCEIKATCTLKRLINTWWDPGLAESQALLNQQIWDGNKTIIKEDGTVDPYNRDSDSGMGQMLGNVLINVAAWKSEDIYIQNIPDGFMKLALEIASKEKSENTELLELAKRLLGITTSASSGAGTTTPSAGTNGPVVAVNVGDYTENFDGDGITAKFLGPFPDGDVVERWRPLAMTAIGIMGIDPVIIDIMMHRIGVESTGNPNAINLGDSNAAAGHPSMGILQCIESTFKAYAVSPYNGHIYSPLGSMLASLNYVNTDPKFHGSQVEKFNNAYGGTAGY